MPSERERRIEAAGDAYAEATLAKHGVGEADLDAIAAALDAADEAVTDHEADAYEFWAAEARSEARRAERAEAALRARGSECCCPYPNPEPPDIEPSCPLHSAQWHAARSLQPAEAAARDVAQQLRGEIHGRIQTIRGMCTDEEPHERIDVALAALDEVVYGLAERLAPSFSGEEGTEG